MNKKDLVNATLEHLIEQVRSAPECFELYDKDIQPELHLTGPTVRWSYKLTLNGKIVDDPNNSARTIIIYYNKLLKQLHCNVYQREVGAQTYALPDATITLKYNYPIFHSTYRKFYKLRNKLIKATQYRENDKYFNNIRTIFPSIFDDKLLGK